MQYNDAGLKYGIDTSAEKFGAKTTIAHLALFSFNGYASRDLSIYDAHDLIERDWLFELADYENEYGVYAMATFKDGSKLTISAWHMSPAENEDIY